MFLRIKYAIFSNHLIYFLCQWSSFDQSIFNGHITIETSISELKYQKSDQTFWYPVYLFSSLAIHFVNFTEDFCKSIEAYNYLSDGCYGRWWSICVWQRGNFCLRDSMHMIKDWWHLKRWLDSNQNHNVSLVYIPKLFFSKSHLWS